MIILILQALSGAFFGMFVFYLFSSLIIRNWMKIDFYKLMLNMSVAFFVAVVCEVYLGKLYLLFMGKPLWQYHVWPIHDGFTSALNFIIWPVYGFYIYCFHYVLESKNIIIKPYWLHGFFSGIDGPLLEILANGFFLLFYKTFYFYYLPDDMRHYTSVQVVPLYMVMGIILSLVLNYLYKKPIKFSYPFIFYLFGFIFILIG